MILINWFQHGGIISLVYLNILAAIRFNFHRGSVEASMAIALDPKQIVSFEELLMSQVVQQEALTRMLVEKGIFSKEEFLEIVGVVNWKIKRRKGGN
jgi:hypothetical protein